MALDKLSKLKVTIVIIVLISLQSIAKNVLEELNDLKNYKDEVVEYERAYSKLKKFLSPNELVGYVTDGQFDDKSFFLAQYALAPVFVANSSKPQLLIAEIHNPSELNKITRKYNSIILHKAGENIFLLQKSLN